MNREQRRAAAKNKDMSQIDDQMALFNKIPDALGDGKKRVTVQERELKKKFKYWND